MADETPTGVVTAVIAPIVFKDPKQGEVKAKGEALDEHGNVIDQAPATEKP